MLSAIPSTPIALPEVLFVDTAPVGEKYPMLRDQYRLTLASTASAALQALALARSAPELVVMELDLSDGPAEEICRRAKLLATPATVLVTTATAERVPDALAAGCDGVLLKPFAPNLLYARIGRLLRARSIELRMRAQRQYAKSAHLSERASLLAARTNRDWPNTHCPHCDHEGVTSFEHTSHRRAWYACLACRHVWMAKRQE